MAKEGTAYSAVGNETCVVMVLLPALTHNNCSDPPTRTIGAPISCNKPFPLPIDSLLCKGPAPFWTFPDGRFSPCASRDFLGAAGLMRIGRFRHSSPAGREATGETEELTNDYATSGSLQGKKSSVYFVTTPARVSNCNNLFEISSNEPFSPWCSRTAFVQQIDTVLPSQTKGNAWKLAKRSDVRHSLGSKSSHQNLRTFVSLSVSLIVCKTPLSFKSPDILKTRPQWT